MDVLIVGAGPTGLTAAVEFARRGIKAHVIEKRETPSPWSRAVGILPRSLDILEPSGVSAALRADGIAVAHARLFRNNRELAAVSLRLDEHPEAALLALPQDRTEFHLADAFRRYDGRVHYGVALTALEQAGGHVRVSLEGGDHIGLPDEFHLVVGADGTGSAVRQALGIDFYGHDLDQDWSIADVDASGWPWPEDFTAFLLDEGRVCVAVPIGADRYRVIADTPDALAALPVPMDVRNARRTSTFRISVRQAVRYGVDRVWLAGDAAHCHSPIGGRGMNLGIADAAALVHHFEADTLQQYSYERHAAGRRVLDVTERARRVVSSRSNMVRALTAGTLQTVMSLPMLRRRMARAILDLN